MCPGPPAAVVWWACWAAWAAALAVRDLRRGRLDDALTLPGLGLALAGAAGCGALPQALAGAAAWAGPLLAAALAAPGRLGGGDVKLGAALGALLGAGAGAAADAAAAAWLAGALSGLLTAAAGLAAGRRSLPHGPAMLAAAGIALAARALPGGAG